MKVLIVSGYFHPQNNPRSYRTTELAKELARRGHDVKVYIPSINYDYEAWGKSYRTLEICQCEAQTWKDVKIHGSGLKYWMRRIMKRILVQFFEYPSIQWYCRMPQILRHEKGYDMLISIAVPHTIHWGIARCIRRGMKPAKTWVADCGDPYMGCGTASFKPPFYFSFFEKSFCRRADYITIPIASAKAGYYPQFQDKMRVIPQAFSFDEAKIIDRYTPCEPVTFGYAGSFVMGERDPRPVLEYLSKIDLDFRFVVYTNQRDFFKDFLPVMGDKLVLKDYLPRNELLYELSKMDFLLNLEYKKPVQRPSKLIDYAFTRRPILSIYSQSFDSLKVNGFLHRDYSQRLMIDNLDDYHIKNVAEKFINLTNY